MLCFLNFFFFSFPGFSASRGFAPFIRPCGPPSPCGGEEGDRGPSTPQATPGKSAGGFACFQSLGRGAGKCRRIVSLYDAFRRPVQCLLPRFSGSSALSSLTGKPPMPQPGRLSAGLFNEAGFSPGPPKDGVTTRHARPAFTNRRRTAFHAAPGILRAFRQTIRHRPHLAGNAFRCIRDGTGRSMARVLRAGICGGEIFLMSGGRTAASARPSRPD